MADQKQQQFKRAPVFRMFAGELKNTTHKLEKNGSDQWEKQYYLTPSGETVSKVMVVGVATEKEDVGTDQSFWRMRVVDPTGGIMVYAGQYQPEAAQIIAGMDLPCFVAMTGKLSLYEPEGGTIVSIRPDTVVVVDEAARNSFIIDAAEQLIARVKEMKATPNAERIKRTKEVYPDISLTTLLDIADMAVKDLMPKPPEAEKKDTEAEQKQPQDEQKGPENKKPEEKKPPGDKKESPPASSSKKDTKKKEQKKTQAAPKEPDPKEMLQKAKDLILEQLKVMNTLDVGKIPDLLKEAGIDPNKVDWEEAVKSLMNEGMCVEPRIGKLRAV